MFKRQDKIDFVSSLASKKKMPIKDSDADGLDDELERRLGTNPCRKDSDNDGLNDYEELFIYQTDPLDKDTDSDGMLDGEEVEKGLNPRGEGLLYDFFIPNERNNFHPRSLKIPRLAFYAIAATVIKAILFFALVSLPIDAWLTPDVNYEQSQKIINLTNKVRISLGIRKLEHNSTLDQAAIAKSQDMLIGQYFAHVSPAKKALNHWLEMFRYNFEAAGENLAMGFNDGSEVVDAWSKSKSHYANMIDKDFAEIGVGVVSGMYHEYDTTFVTQMFGTPVTAKAREQKPKIAQVQEKPKAEIPEKPEAQIEIKLKPTSTPAQKAPAVKTETAEIRRLALAEKAEMPKVKSRQSDKQSGAKAADPALPAPTVDKLPQGAYNNEGIVTLSVKAPLSQKVLIMDGENVIASTTGPVTNWFVSLELSEGLHKIKAISVRGKEKKLSDILEVTVDNSPPVLDLAKSNVEVVQTGTEGREVIKVTAYLSPDTVQAIANYKDYNIKLSPENDSINVWTGEAIIYDKAQISDPLVLASITASDRAGSTVTGDIGWNNAHIAKSSALDQYFFIKDHQSKYAGLLFNISTGFYKLLLAFLMISLVLKIFIEIRKQHPHIILSTLGLITMLVFFILI